MQELIELLERFKGSRNNYDGDPWVTRGLLISIAEAKKLLRTEREQIEVAYRAGKVNFYDVYATTSGVNVTPDDYYTKTYSKDERTT